MENELITVASIGLADFFNGQVYRLERFVQQRKESFKEQNGIKLSMKRGGGYIGNSDTIFKMKKFEQAQKAKTDELRAMSERVKQLQYEIIENCKILEGFDELI